MSLKQKRRRESGVTLAELMVVVGITSGLTLLVSSILVNTMQVNRQIHLQADLISDVENLFYTLEQYVGQTTQVISCNCVAGGGCAGNDALNTDAPDGTVFQFTYEDSGDPMAAPRPECAYAAGAQIPGSTIYPLGCKRTIALVYTAPTQAVAPSTPSQPGTLVVREVTSTGTGDLATFSNITSFACAIPSAGAALTNGALRVRVNTKARQNPTENINVPEYESWTAAGGPGSANFAKGVHRSHVSEITFRNITTPGVVYGKVRQYRECVPDVEVAPAVENCCSGYRDSGSGTCMPVSRCVMAPNSADTELCCSHMVSPSSGACI